MGWNWQTGRSKGYGFIEFKNDEACRKALTDEPQQIAGKVVDVKPRQVRGGKSDGKGKDKGKLKNKNTKGSDSKSKNVKGRDGKPKVMQALTSKVAKQND